RLTVVDASAETLAINRTKLGDDAARVEYIEADVFTWAPPRHYDVVFFSFWLSHVPYDRFDDFWLVVDRALAPGGRVLFVDNAHPKLARDKGPRIEIDLPIDDGVATGSDSVTDLVHGE